MRSADIKNLSIAMKALSRIPGEDAVNLSERIRDLLTDIVREEERRPEPNRVQKSFDEEIPF